MDKLKSVFNPVFRFFGWIFKSKIRIGILILLVLVVGYFGFHQLTSKSQQPQYQTSTAEKGTLITSVSASGTISSGSSVDLTTSATGIVSQVYVKDGDTITQGQKIADITLDQASQQKQTAAWASYLQAKNSLASAQSQLNSLQASEFQANQDFINDAVARGLETNDPTYIQENATWLQAEQNYQNQANVITQSQASLSSAWLSYLQTSPTITAPVSGTITGLTLTPGLPIVSSSSSDSSNSTTQTLGSIKVGDHSVQASVNLSEIDVTKIKVGQKVTLTLDAFPDKTFTGKVSAINTTGSVSSGVTTYPATITLDTDQNNIYPNMAVAAQIITNVDTDVVLVPSAAVTTANGESFVQVLKNGTPQSVTVETGNSNDTQTEIKSGINEGDSVITGTTSTGARTGTGTTTSPFSTFGGARGGFGGGGNVVRISR